MSEDKVGNKGSIPSSFNWTIDTKSPSTSISSATDGNNNLMAPGSNTPSNSMTFVFSITILAEEDKGVGINRLNVVLITLTLLLTVCQPVEITPDISYGRQS